MDFNAYISMADNEKIFLKEMKRRELKLKSANAFYIILCSKIIITKSFLLIQLNLFQCSKAEEVAMFANAMFANLSRGKLQTKLDKNLKEVLIKGKIMIVYFQDPDESYFSVSRK